MFKKRSKKGLSHVDWAMSLAIFLLYLAWFFIFVKPVLTPSQNMDVLLDILEDGVRDYVFEDTERLSVLVTGSFVSDYEPIVIPFDHAWRSSDISHTAEYFVVDEGRMFFLANLSNTSMFRIYHPHKALRTRPPAAIIANEARVWSGEFSAHFDDYLLSYIFFMDERRLRDFSVEVDDTVLDEPGSFGNWSFMAEYQRAGDYLNLSSYVFGENSRVYSYITPSDFRNHSVVIDFTIYNYTFYYFDPVTHGELTYGARERCQVHESDFLDLYDYESGLLIAFSKNISFTLCTNETDAKLTLEFDSYVGETDRLDLVLHEGNVDDVIGYPPEPVVGVTETLHTVSADRISLIKNRDYGYLKQLFGYPNARDFNVTFTSDVVSGSGGMTPPELVDVYARKIDGFVIDQGFEPKRVLITLTVW